MDDRFTPSKNIELTLPMSVSALDAPANQANLALWGESPVSVPEASIVVQCEESFAKARNPDASMPLVSLCDDLDEYSFFDVDLFVFATVSYRSSESTFHPSSMGG